MEYAFCGKMLWVRSEYTMQLALFNHTMEWMKRQPLTDYPEIQANPEALVIVFECPDDISDHVNFLLKIIKPETTTKKIA